MDFSYVSAVEWLDGYRLRLTFEDGTVGDVDLAYLVGRVRCSNPCGTPTTSLVSALIGSWARSCGRTVPTWLLRPCTPPRTATGRAPDRLRGVERTLGKVRAGNGPGRGGTQFTAGCRCASHSWKSLLRRQYGAPGADGRFELPACRLRDGMPWR